VIQKGIQGMAGSGGPWGGGGGNNGDDRGGRNNGGGDDDNRGGQRRPNDPPGLSQIDDLVKSGQERLRVLMGGRGGQGGGNGRGPGGGGRGPEGPMITRQGIGLAALAAVAVWGFMSFYSVRPEERSVELFLGEFSQIGEPGLNFAPWPLVSKDIVQVGVEQTTEVGLGGDAASGGLMLTRDQNIVDVGFQVVWNISDPSAYLFNLADPNDTIRAVSESAMRDIIARSELSPILNRDRGLIVADLRTATGGSGGCIPRGAIGATAAGYTAEPGRCLCQPSDRWRAWSGSGLAGRGGGLSRPRGQRCTR
jgi:modulator of FtsH protease HflK